MRGGAVTVSGLYFGTLGPFGGEVANHTTASAAGGPGEGATPARFVARYQRGAAAPTWLRASDDGRFSELELAVAEDGAVLVVGNVQPPEGWRLLRWEELPVEQPALTVLRLEASGEPDWVRGWPVAGFLELGGVALSGTGRLFVAGAFQGQWTFASRPLVAPQTPALFVAAIEATGREAWARFTARSGAVRADRPIPTSDGDVLAGGTVAIAGAERHEPFVLRFGP